MKKLLAAAMAALGIFLAGHAQALPTLQFNGSGPYNVVNGQTLSVSLGITGLGSEIVSAFDLDVLFDSALLSPVGLTLDSRPLLGGLDSMDGTDFLTTAGLWNVWALSFLSDSDLAALQSPAGGAFSLFTMEFIGNADGTTVLTMGPLGADIGKDIKGAGNVVIVPNQVPEPGTLLLLSGALLVLVARRRATVQPA